MTINAERLLHLADFLERVPPKRFNIDIVVTADPTPEKFQSLLENPNQTCNSAACAMGWCPIAFPKLFCYVGRDIALIGNPIIGETYNSVCQAFGLVRDDAYHLFEPRYYPPGCTPQMVADKIRFFVKGKMADVVDI